MERTRRADGSVTGLEDLGRLTESALQELDALRKRVQFQGGAPERPESGDTYYDDQSDTFYIWNESEGVWKVH